MISLHSDTGTCNTNLTFIYFVSAPDKSQIEAAVKLLANIGCVDISNMERDGGDGAVTKLGKTVSKLPLGVRVSLFLLLFL